MDFAITEEHRMMVDSVRQFREKELMPLEKEFLLKGKLDIEVRHGLERKGREAGFWALEVPAEYGGNDVGQLAMCLINEELFKHPAMFEFGGSPEPALYLCNDEQKQRFFYPIINGEKHSCYAFTEPDAGSDLARIRTTAVRDGNRWIVNGTKTFISYVEGADFVILFTSSNSKMGARGITCFLVDMGTPGFRIAREIPTMGDNWDPHELQFTDCVIPDSNRLGEADGGFAVADYQLTHGRLKSVPSSLESLRARSKWRSNGPSSAPLGANRSRADRRSSGCWPIRRSSWKPRGCCLSSGLDGRREAENPQRGVHRQALRDRDGATRHRPLHPNLRRPGYTRELPIQSFFRQVAYGESVTARPKFTAG